MISLYKIRYTYLKRHPCSLICGYLFLPAMVIIIFIPISISQIKERIMSLTSFSDNIQFTNSLYKNDKNLFEDFISNNIEKPAILAQSKENGKKLSEFIEKETNIKINYYTEEDELNKNNYTNIIIYNQKNGRYEFKLKNIDRCNNNFYDFKEIYRCLKFQFSLRENGLKEKIESLVTKFISSDKNNKSLNVTILAEHLYSSYLISLIASILGLYLSFEMTLFSYYFTERMIEEKEKKLQDFLERQGISKRQYIMSWFNTYLILSILPFISFLIVCGVSFLSAFFVGLIDYFYICLVYLQLYIFFIQQFHHLKKDQ